MMNQTPMSLVIRFSKMGRRGERKYRIVVKEKRSKRDGDPVDTIGYYEKRVGVDIIKKIDSKKLSYWTEKGAIISPAVKKII